MSFASDDSVPNEALQSSWLEVAAKKLRLRWVQVSLVIIVGALAMLVSALVLAPKAAPRAKDPKFLYCPECEYETRYDLKLDGEPCSKCREEPVGKLEGRDQSVKQADRKSPWRWVYLATSFELLITVGAVVFLLYRPAPDPGTTFYVFSCPHCGQRLRFRHVSLGGLGQCSRCKRPVRFPTVEDAVKEEDLIREEQARLDAETEEEDEEDE